MTLDDLNKIAVPPYPQEINPCYEKGYGQDVRLKCYLEKLRETDPVNSADEALYLVNECIEHVEDLYSGFFKEVSTPIMKTSRMYKALSDNIDKREDGGYTVKTRGNRIEIDINGTFTIFHRKTGEEWLKKNGR